LDEMVNDMFIRGHEIKSIYDNLTMLNILRKIFATYFDPTRLKVSVSTVAHK